MAVDAVTPEQVATVVARNSTEASIETAQVYAAMNHMAKTMPGGQLPAMISDDMGSLWAMHAVPMPKLTGPEKTIKPHTLLKGRAGQFDNRSPPYQVTGRTDEALCFEDSS